MNEPDGRHSIFVVDDEPIIASTFAAILRLKGFNCISFTKPSEALIAALSSPPDLLLTDINMPLLSGVELASKVREHSPSCKVFLHSGQIDNSELLHNALSRGHHFELIRKPCRPADLLNRIRMACASVPLCEPSGFPTEINRLLIVPEASPQQAA